MKNVISRCPICAGELVISRLSCCACETKIETELTLAGLMRLPADLQEFVLVFLRCRGNIREVEKELGISYPTVCKRLDLVNELLDTKAGKKMGRTEILTKLERGEI
ncbi:MAG: DUF2089 domain-containing protein, partial [Phycisphaerales bacterium]|nr:DUF2089 domain-containing protein [Phycisphaerales bacterium]